MSDVATMPARTCLSFVQNRMESIALLREGGHKAIVVSADPHELARGKLICELSA